VSKIHCVVRNMLYLLYSYRLCTISDKSFHFADTQYCCSLMPMRSLTDCGFQSNLPNFTPNPIPNPNSNPNHVLH